MTWFIPFFLGLSYAFFGITGDNHFAFLTNANIWLAVAYIVARK